MQLEFKVPELPGERGESINLLKEREWELALEIGTEGRTLTRGKEYEVRELASGRKKGSETLWIQIKRIRVKDKLNF